jgi:hypothetical protein
MRRGGTMKYLPLLLAIAILGGSGCASKTPGSAEAHRLAATQPVDPQSELSLEEIEPRLVLPAPATRPSGEAPLEAIRVYAQARAALVDNQRFTALNLARAYQASNPSAPAGDRAMAAFERAAAIRPDSLDLHYELGRQYLDRNDTPHALDHLRLARMTSDYQNDRHADIAALTDFFLARSLAKSGYTAAALRQYGLLVRRLSYLSTSSRTNSELVYFIKHPQILYAETGELFEKKGHPHRPRRRARQGGQSARRRSGRARPRQRRFDRAAQGGVFNWRHFPSFARLHRCPPHVAPGASRRPADLLRAARSAQSR